MKLDLIMFCCFCYCCSGGCGCNCCGCSDVGKQCFKKDLGWFLDLGRPLRGFHKSTVKVKLSVLQLKFTDATEIPMILGVLVS